MKHALKRGLIFTKGTGPAMWRTLFDVSSDLVIKRKPPMKPFIDSRWPSHLHIDILQEGRGTGFGKELINRIIDRFRQMGSPGLHLETVLENRNAVQFFKAMGFQEFGDTPELPGIRAKDGSRLHGLVMIMDLN
jgi:GNAT superfamily N-acetyltransferase